tara:strand:- start:4971 stop:5861 length:891 start_codon:yes stop_codon:yes gene_type:complete
MPDTEETKIDVGDSEESPIEVDLSEEKNEESSQGEEKVEVEAASEEKDKELDDYSRNAKSRINDLTAKYREEERQKQTALQFAENVRKENEALKHRLDNLDKGYQEEFGNRVTSQIDSAKRILKDAHESGDVDKLVEAQEALAQLTAEKQRLSVAQKEVQQEQPAAPQAPQPQAQPAPTPDPRAQAWAEKNDWFGNDEAMTYAAFGIHRRLVEDEGFDPQSEAYYSEIDKRLKSEFPHKLGQKGATAGGSQKVASAEGSKSRNKGGRRKVRLSASQIAIAKKLNVPLEEYAKYVRD